MRKITTPLVRYQKKIWLVIETRDYGLVILKDTKGGNPIHVLNPELEEIPFSDYLKATKPPL